MELWIRSQDKESITKVSNIQYACHNDLHIIGTYYDNLEVLGKYKSKERALEVLDEIQNILHPIVLMSGEINTNDNNWVEEGIIYQKYKDNFKYKNNFSAQHLSTYVYEMPKE